MPLVGGNELSLLSISFTICFYLVINKSSVWWLQAAGCLLAAAHTSHTNCQTSLCFLYTHMQPTMHTHHVLTTTYLCRNMFLSVLNPECSSKKLKHSRQTPALFSYSYYQVHYFHYSVGFIVP